MGLLENQPAEKLNLVVFWNVTSPTLSQMGFQQLLNI